MTNFSMQETQRVLIECKNSPYCNQPCVKEACRQLFWARDEIVNLRRQVTELEQKVVESNHRNLDLQYMLGPSKRTQFALDTAKFWIDQYEGQAKHIAELEADLEYYKSGFHSERGVHERVAAILGTDDAPWMLAQRAIERIAELEEENRQLVHQILTDDDKDRLIAKQRTALKKLGQAKRERGKALVEERARRLHEDNGSLRCDHYGSSECGEAWQNFCGFEGCPHQKDFVRLAREQLRREGKL